MVIYIAFILVVTSLFLIAGDRPKLKNAVLAAAFLIMWLLVGLRATSIGTDTKSYFDFFNFALSGDLDVAQIVNPTRLFIVDGFETGFKLYTYFATLLTSNFTVYLLITYGFIYFSFYKFIKRYSLNYLLSFNIFAALFFFDSMNIMRQFVALAIITWGFGYIIKRKPIKYFAIVALATLFHQASIVMILPYFLYGRRFTRLSFVVYVVGALVSLPLIAPVVQLLASTNMRYETYVDKLGVFQPGSYLVVGFYLGILLLMIYLAQVPLRKQGFDEKGVLGVRSVHLFLHMAALSVVMSILSLQMSGLNRATKYFSMFILISLPFLFYCNRHVRGMKSTELGVIGGVMLYAFTMLILKPEWLNVWPYILAR